MRDDVPWKRVSNEVIEPVVREVANEALRRGAWVGPNPPKVLDADRIPGEKWSGDLKPFTATKVADRPVRLEVDVIPTHHGRFEIRVRLAGEEAVLPFDAGPFLEEPGRQEAEQAARERLYDTIKDRMHKHLES